MADAQDAEAAAGVGIRSAIDALPRKALKPSP
jgi:hypothetical protein